MAIKFFRLLITLATLLLLFCANVESCQAQPLPADVTFAYRCNVNDLFMPSIINSAGWLKMNDGALFIPPKARCWLRLTTQNPQTEADRAKYYILQRSPLVDAALFDASGTEIARSTHDQTTHVAIDIGRRIMFPLAKLSDGPLYVRLDSSNPIYQERVVNKGFSTVSDGVMTQQAVLTATIFSATLLLTSAMFTASFGVVLRDLDFGIYSIYALTLGITLLAWDQANLQAIGSGYGWIWQLSNPLSTVMLCWLAIRFGKFHKHSILVSNLLIVEMSVNLVLLLWAILSLLGVPMMAMPFERFNYENWLDVVTGTLIIIGGWRGWRRGDTDCLILMLSLVPSMISDFINRIWDPAIAPFLQSSLGYALPEWLNKTIHFNGSLTWIALPMVFCFALARRAMQLHMTLIDERKRLEDRVLHRTHELHIANKELELLATTDSLTGLANRRCMMECIKREIERSDRSKKSLALCMIDVDHFKNINDTHGHPTGDRAIMAIAAACNESIRKTDIASRFGGEEFVMLMPETELTEATIVTERLRAAIEALPILSENGQPFSMTVSIGVAFFDHQTSDDNMSKLLNRADKALYNAKNAGRNQVVLS
jgi:diguanylate cyclase (GGDEF)-like protein